MPHPSGRPLHAGDGKAQSLLALLTNRSKRNKRAGFVVQGVRPISQALAHGWPVQALLVHAGGDLSAWARRTIDAVAGSGGEILEAEPALMEEFGQQDHCPELVLIATLPRDDLARVPTSGVAVVVDRPTQNGNLGSIIRSADAFGATGVLVSGHGVDPYDPATVRATTGSMFALPTVRIDGPDDVRTWLDDAGGDVQIVGTDEQGIDLRSPDVGLTVPTLLVLGNETRGMSHAWRNACDLTVSIPMVGSASSLNVANAASILLYEMHRRRHPLAR